MTVLSSLQRLISLRAVSLSAVPAIIQTMNDRMWLGVDIQLKILQTLLTFITNFPCHSRPTTCRRAYFNFAFVQRPSFFSTLFCRMLNVEYAPVTPQALLSCFKLEESRTVVVSFMVATMLGQLVMFVLDNLKVIEEDCPLLLASELESITLLD